MLAVLMAAASFSLGVFLLERMATKINFPAEENASFTDGWRLKHHCSFHKIATQ